MMTQATVLLLAVAAGVLFFAASATAAEGGRARGLRLSLRRRVPGPGGDIVPKREGAEWDPSRTAVIVCDMWDEHWCASASRRVAEMAPRLDDLLVRLREAGVLVVHAPSETMRFYEDHPGRRMAKEAPRAADLPEGIAGGCGSLDSEKGSTWPVDQSDGGCDCKPKCKGGHPWRRQIEAIRIIEGDAVSDSGEEIWNLFAERRVVNVLVTGVHTNMCVVGRPFGLRNMARFGKRVVLVRDLTDTMYNPRKRPFVSHFRGTELVVEHIERYICPTVCSSEITGREPFRFRGDVRPRAVVAVAEREYRTWKTLPGFAGRVLGNACDLSVSVLYGGPGKERDMMPGFAEEVERADLVLLSVRRRAWPARDLAALRGHLEAGKPLVAVRTSSHAFDTKGKHAEGHDEWRAFDREVLGCRYSGHHGAGPETLVTASPGGAGHPVLEGVEVPFTSRGSLYRSSPLAEGATPLLTGAIPGKAPEPVAWTHTYKGARVFYTSLGHPGDFGGPAEGGSKETPLVRLLTNAVFWAMGMPVPAGRAEQ